MRKRRVAGLRARRDAGPWQHGSAPLRSWSVWPWPPSPPPPRRATMWWSTPPIRQWFGDRSSPPARAFRCRPASGREVRPVADGDRMSSAFQSTCKAIKPAFPQGQPSRRLNVNDYSPCRSAPLHPLGPCPASTLARAPRRSPPAGTCCFPRPALHRGRPVTDRARRPVGRKKDRISSKLDRGRCASTYSTASQTLRQRSRQPAKGARLPVRRPPPATAPDGMADLGRRALVRDEGPAAPSWFHRRGIRTRAQAYCASAARRSPRRTR